MKIARRILFAVWLLICLFGLLVLPTNKYEWMQLSDPNASLPIDGNASMYPVLAVVPILAGALFLIFFKLRAERVFTVAVLVILIGAWIGKFRTTLFG